MDRRDFLRSLGRGAVWCVAGLSVAILGRRGNACARERRCAACARLEECALPEGQEQRRRGGREHG